MDLIKKAEDFCKLAHVMQKRKYNFEPYWHHCREVAFLVEAIGGTPEMVAAAWLHDTVEDTGTSMKTIVSEFGHEVGILVDDLTDVSKPEDGNRAVRKEMDRAHTAAATPKAKTIKLADLISNSASINRHDPDFARVYMREKGKLLEVLGEGDLILYSLAKDIMRRYFAKEAHSEAKTVDSV